VKQILFLIAIVAISIGSVTAQTARGNFGTIQPALKTQLSCYNAAGVAKTAYRDTLVSADTGYMWTFISNNYNYDFDFLASAITGTVTGTAYLQGSMDSSKLTADWRTITGITTYCASCSGASASVSTSTNTHYHWQLPVNTGNQWQYYRIFFVKTDTGKARYTATYWQKY